MWREGAGIKSTWEELNQCLHCESQCLQAKQLLVHPARENVIPDTKFGTTTWLRGRWVNVRLGWVNAV